MERYKPYSIAEAEDKQWLSQRDTILERAQVLEKELNATIRVMRSTKKLLKSEIDGLLKMPKLVRDPLALADKSFGELFPGLLSIPPETFIKKLGMRTRRQLDKVGIKTREDLSLKRPRELLRFHRFSRRSLDDLMAFLDSEGLK